MFAAKRLDGSVRDVASWLSLPKRMMWQTTSNLSTTDTVSNIPNLEPERSGDREIYLSPSPDRFEVSSPGPEEVNSSEDEEVFQQVQEELATNKIKAELALPVFPEGDRADTNRSGKTVPSPTESEMSEQERRSIEKLKSLEEAFAQKHADMGHTALYIDAAVNTRKAYLDQWLGTLGNYELSCYWSWKWNTIGKEENVPSSGSGGRFPRWLWPGTFVDSMWQPQEKPAIDSEDADTSELEADIGEAF